MRKAVTLGILGSFFFAFTFILNRSMNLAGGYWIWSASLRYLFMLPLMALLVWKAKGMQEILAEIKRAPGQWLLWSTIGFGLFYAPLTLGSVYGESWLVAASWQLTIVAGIMLTPLFGKPLPKKNLGISVLILAGVFLIQFQNAGSLSVEKTAMTLLPIVVAAFSYPLGNRKMMQICPAGISTVQRIFGMALCSMPFWVLLSVAAVVKEGLPNQGQVIQSFGVALLSGVIATVLFFQATDLVKNNHKQLAVVEATQAGEVVFTLLGGVLLLGDALPSGFGIAGILLVVGGMVWNSLACR